MNTFIFCRFVLHLWGKMCMFDINFTLMYKNITIQYNRNTPVASTVNTVEFRNSDISFSNHRNPDLFCEVSSFLWTGSMPCQRQIP